MTKNFIIGRKYGELGNEYYAILYADRKLTSEEMDDLYNSVEEKLYDEGNDDGFCDVLDVICEENPGWHWEDWSDAFEALEVEVAW